MNKTLKFLLFPLIKTLLISCTHIPRLNQRERNHVKMTAKSPSDNFLEEFESIEVIGQGSFGKIRKVRRKKDGMVS